MIDSITTHIMEYPVNRMKSAWRFADGDANALFYDLTLKVVCLDDPCSVANCGHQARCLVKNNTASCECKDGFLGNAYERYVQ